MDEAQVGLIHRATDGGVSGTHPVAIMNEVLVGPSTSEQRNKVTTAIIPVACWRVEDLRFEFDSSFVRPELAEEIEHLVQLRENHKKEVKPAGGDNPALYLYPPLSIFGHADPVGDDNYNKQLSGRRAAAIYGMLTRDTHLWEEIYSHPYGGDNWARNSVNTMLVALGYVSQGDGHASRQTTDGMKRFQKENGLPASGHADAATRAKLFRAYMDKLCGKEFVLDKKEDFLAGTDHGGQGDYQGCGEFNPVLLFSQKEEAEFSHKTKERNVSNAPNRRVMVLLFRPGSRVRFDRWPCPRAKEGVAACHKRFWSDGEKRRSLHLPDERREYKKSKGTFACRFYDRLASQSPCERTLESCEIRLYDPSGQFIAFAPYEITLGKRKPFSGTADESGIVVLKDLEVPNTCIVRWGYQPQPGEAPMLIFSLNMFLNIEAQDEKEEAREKLNNLSYCNAELTESVNAFQCDYGQLVQPPLARTGDLDNRTMELLRKVYKDCADDLRNTKPV